MSRRTDAIVLLIEVAAVLAGLCFLCWATRGME